MTIEGTTDLNSEPEATEGLASSEEPRKGVSRGALVLAVLVAVVISGVAGLAIGWKVEQQRVKDDLANIRPVGTVTAVTDDSVTIELRTASGTRTYKVTDATVVDGAAGGDVSDLVEGSIILVKNRRGDDGKLQATEIVVLPESTTFGGGSKG